MQYQRIPIPLQRIEFQHILQGLHKPQKALQQIIPKRNTSQPQLLYLQNITKNEKSQLVPSDTLFDDRILQKLEKLRKQPSTFFEKVPKDPITLMNSSKRNKFFEIRLLAQTREEVQKSSSVQLNAKQEEAIKELLDKYPRQFSFTTSQDARKKKEVQETKEKYMKQFFIKSSCHGVRKKQKIKQVSEIIEVKKNKSVLNLIEELECPGYCTFIKQLAVKKFNDYN